MTSKGNIEGPAFNPLSGEWTESELTMSAAELFASALFEEADNDVMYHHSPAQVVRALAHGQCSYTSEEIAERILAWSGALR